MMQRSALVTGAGRSGGIGAGIACALAAHGWDLALSCWHPYDERVNRTRADFTEQQPTGRLGIPADVAGVAAFLLSPQGRWVSGQLIKAGGGFSAS